MHGKLLLLLLLQARLGWLFRQGAALIQSLCLSLANPSDALFSIAWLSANVFIISNYLHELAGTKLNWAATTSTTVSGLTCHASFVQK